MFGQKKHTPWFFDSSIHLEAVSRLMYLVEVSEPFGVVCGADGSGRTRILTRVRQEIERTGKQVVSLNLAGLDETAALTQLVTSVSASARRNMARHELVALLRDEIAGRSHCGVHSVVLIDESFLRILTALNSGAPNAGGQGKLTVIVASDRPLTNGLSVESLLQIRLTPLDSAESFEFVRSLARRHGIADSSLHDNTIAAIHHMSRGNTARMKRVCELLAVLHEASPETLINTETVTAVIQELSPRAVA
jgi:general secretion pathway protein A